MKRTCVALVEKCKQEAKQLLEFNAAKKELHWSHPSFNSFCASVEDVLCHGVKWHYRSSKTKVVSSSGKVLQDLGKNYPLAAEVFETCFNSTQDPSSREDYTVLHTNSLAERKVLWLRVALYEGKLHGIIEEILKNPRHYYTEQSVMCDPVYGEIFGYLLYGPCALQFSHYKTSDFLIPPSPIELVERHNKFISNAIFKSQQSVFSTEEAWDHVRSLYQSPLSTCLFGKNYMLMQPAGFPEPLDGYLSLQMGVTTLLLKWIPNCLLKDGSNAENSSLWEHVLSVDIGTIAHIHCHRSSGQSAELILIGYNGIAYPRIVFPHQPSFFHFLECLENSLLPHSCLEPPLWYLREQTIKNKKLKCPLSPSGEHGEGKGEEVEWWEGVEVWNQAFRVRAGSRKEEEEDKGEPSGSELRLMRHFPTYNCSEHSFDLEKFQSKVLKLLLGIYFYSWLSYCRHMRKVREEVAHMVRMDMVISPTNSAHKYPQSLTEKMWREFLGSSDPADKWVEVLRAVYLKGMDKDLRAEVWPFLLGLYPINSTPEERAAINQQSLEHYQRVLSKWTLVDSGSLDEEDFLVSDLDPTSVTFPYELYKIDKDIPRCDRDYSYFQKDSNLKKLRSIVSSYVWMHMKVGYSQGMCDMLAPLLVTFDNEALSYACYLRLMEGVQELFLPGDPGMKTKLSNLWALLKIVEPDFFQYLQDSSPMGDALFNCYRWFKVSFKREFGYSDIFHLWESTWAARWCVSSHFEEFFALAIMQQFKTAIMDIHLDPSDILNLFTELAQKKAIDCCATIEIAQSNIAELQIALAKKDDQFVYGSC